VPDETPPDVAFDAATTDSQIVAWSRRYAERAGRSYDLDVDLDRVEWTVSTRAKRRAAGVKHPRVADASVGEPIDWSASSVAGAAATPPTCTISLTRAAFEAYSRTEWAETIRHELLHVEQFQRFGATDHGEWFRRRSEAVDAPVSCRRFATPAYRLTCRGCGEVVARRYRDCKLVREHDRYRSNCCGAALDCAAVEG
jgi:predicted SprT family Zn-dependent metalloprotease